MAVVAYCTPEDVKTINRLNITSADDDAALAQFIDAVSLRIDQMQHVPAGGYAVSADTTRYYQYDEIHNGRLFLGVPCLSVTTLTNGNDIVIPSNSYRLHPRNEDQKFFVELLRLAGYDWGYDTDGEITVVGKFGYSLTPPPNVVEATAVWAGWILKRYQAALQDASVNFDLGQLVYNKAVPDQVKALLQPAGAMF